MNFYIPPTTVIIKNHKNKELDELMKFATAKYLMRGINYDLFKGKAIEVKIPQVTERFNQILKMSSMAAKKNEF